ncbi:MAG: GNAT family N-acetyltransferase [Bdellovibrionota bacterium]|nr:MAG: GNAT family N-acetyltransferase [Bdellovibrionota bacterium]
MKMNTGTQPGSTRNPNIAVDEMLSADLAEVIALGESIPEFRTETEAAQFYSRETLERWLTEPTGVALVSRDGGVVVAFVLAQYMPASRDGYLNVITVAESLRGKGGLAEGLLERAFQILERKGCDHVFGSVQDSNERALRFFEKRGLQRGDTFRYVEAMLQRE